VFIFARCRRVRREAQELSFAEFNDFMRKFRQLSAIPQNIFLEKLSAIWNSLVVKQQPFGS
jgi:hypothetical protein